MLLHSYRMLAYHHIGFKVQGSKFHVLRQSFMSYDFEPSTLNFELDAIRNFGAQFEPRCIVGAGPLNQ